jgi:hypothetical protein
LFSDVGFSYAIHPYIQLFKARVLAADEIIDLPQR